MGNVAKKNWASFQIEKDLDSLGKFGILPRDNGWQKSGLNN